MFSIRTRMFETNSSSVHSFIVPKESKLLKIPKLVKIFGPADPTTPEGRIRLMHEEASCAICYSRGFERGSQGDV